MPPRCRARFRRCDPHRPVNDVAAAPARRFSDPLVWVPFVLISLIWGSTWLIIKDQISLVPPTWTISYRFAIATIGMFALAAWRGDGWRVSRAGWGIVALVGVAQFVFNFQFVYHAELWLTSGLVAVIFSLVFVPNAIMGRIFLGQAITRGFLVGSAFAICGIALLIAHEYRVADIEGGIWFGAVFAVLGMLAASVAGIAQATPTGRAQPFIPMLAWSMAVGCAINIGFSLVSEGAPTWDGRWEYGAGIVYLALCGSVLTFPLYFGLVRSIGAGRAAYNGAAVPLVAMTLSTLFEGYRWDSLAAVGSVLTIIGIVVALKARR